MQILNDRFGHDSIISVATVHDGHPSVRNVDAYFEDGAFYTVTYALSNKIQHIKENPEVAISGEWFTAVGTGENIGWVKDEKNAEIMSKLSAAFASWYANDHSNEDDPNTCILRVALTNGLLFNQGARYDIDFARKTA